MFIDWLIGYNRLHAGFAEINLLCQCLALAGRTNGFGGQSGIFFNFQHSFVNGRSSSGFCAVQSVVNRGIVDSRQSNVHRSFCRIRFKLGLYAERVFSVVVSFGIIPLNQLRKTRQEVGIVFLFRAGPLNFTQCSPTRQYHVLRVREGSDVFCPEVGLHTLDIFLFFRSQRSRHRFVAVHSFQRQVTTDTKWFVIYVFSLVIVEIQVCVRCHDDIVFLFRSFDTALFTTP